MHSVNHMLLQTKNPDQDSSWMNESDTQDFDIEALDFDTAWSRFMSEQQQQQQQQQPLSQEHQHHLQNEQEFPQQETDVRLGTPETAAAPSSLLNPQESSAFTRFLDTLLVEPSSPRTSHRIDEELQKLSSLLDPRSEAAFPEQEMAQFAPQYPSLESIPEPQLPPPQQHSHAQSVPQQPQIDASTRYDPHFMGVPSSSSSSSASSNTKIHPYMAQYQPPPQQQQQQPQHDSWQQTPNLTSRQSLPQQPPPAPPQQHPPHQPPQPPQQQQQPSQAVPLSLMGASNGLNQIPMPYQQQQKFPPQYPYGMPPQTSANGTQIAPPSQDHHVYYAKQSSPQTTPGPKRKQNSSVAQTRLNHVNSEKRRRAIIKDLFNQLCGLVPAVKSTPDSLPKSAVLQHVYERIIGLRENNDRIRKQLELSGVWTNSIARVELDMPVKREDDANTKNASKNDTDSRGTNAMPAQVNAATISS